MDLLTRPETSAAPAGRPRSTRPDGGMRGVAGAACSMVLIGTLMAVSATIGDYPLFTGQAIRYGLAALILLPLLLRAPVLPRGIREWGLLTALAATGLVGFNYCLVEASRSADPATVGAVVGASPVVLAVAGPLIGGYRPSTRVIGCALVVAAGAALANGLGDGDPRGLLFSLGALGGEVLFSLLAVPLLPRLGPLRVSVYSTLLALPLLLAAALLTGESPRLPTPAEGTAFAYVGVVITAGTFLLWFDALGRLGPDRAALFGGLIPVSAAATGVVLGLGAPAPGQLLGCLLVAVGVTCGVRR
ncbi:DMT family transporter [Actinocorallia sp. B10E7]|uniref:DMT family transporter n=1 Tax=Actinocorallia sp. B10E7 TaxID=3153558 RepID=UPI00325DC1D1